MGSNISISCTASACANTYRYKYYLANILIFDGSTQMLTGQALPSGYAQILDTKLDDGLPTTGSITSANLGSGWHASSNIEVTIVFTTT